MTYRNWIIRRANLSDVSEIIKCIDISTHDIDFKKEIMDNPVWLAEYNNRLIGCLVLHLTEEIVYITYVNVIAEFREKGLGRSLMEFAEKEAIKRGCNTVVAVLHNKYMQYMPLYEHLGWKKKLVEKNQITIYKKIEECVEVL